MNETCYKVSYSKLYDIGIRTNSSIDLKVKVRNILTYELITWFIGKETSIIHWGKKIYFQQMMPHQLNIFIQLSSKIDHEHTCERSKQ